MLVAQTKDGKPISLLDNWSRSELTKLRREGIFHCPICKEQLQLKHGAKRIAHFSHKKGTECTVPSEPESKYHLDGKRQLYEWIVSQDVKVELEPHLTTISQRPDLLVFSDHKRYAIEFQCSTIPQHIFLKRTISYYNNDIFPIWIIGAKSLNQVAYHHISLSPFQWLFALTQKSKHNQQLPRIILFCPNNSQFTILTQLTPFSPGITFCRLTSFKLNQKSFSELLEETSEINLSYEQWQIKKQQWRIQISTYFPSKMRKLYSTLYQNNIPPGLFPSEAGIPLSFSYWIHSAAVIWQLWVLLDSIIPVQIGDTLSYREVYQRFLKRVSGNDIQIRKLPMVRNSHFSFAVMEYLQALTRLNILRKIDKTLFKKEKHIRIPPNLEEAFEMDKACLRIFAKPTKGNI